MKRINKLMVLLLSVSLMAVFACSCGGGGSSEPSEPEVAPEDKVSYMTDGKFNSDAATVFAGIEQSLDSVTSCESHQLSANGLTLNIDWASGDIIKDIEVKFDKYGSDGYEDLSETTEIPEIAQFLCYAPISNDSFDKEARVDMEGIATILKIIDPVEFEGNQENLPETLMEMLNGALSKVTSNQPYGNYDKTMGDYTLSIAVMPKDNTTLAIGVYFQTKEEDNN